ncbi:hypothetical protein HKD37_11G032016 [Glycine soja]
MSSEEQHHHHSIQWHLNKLNGSISTFHSYSQSLFLLLWFFAILIFVSSLFLCIHLCRHRFSQQKRTTSSPLLDQCVVGIEFMTNHTMVPSSSTASMVVAGFEKEEECCICLSLFREALPHSKKWIHSCLGLTHSTVAHSSLRIETSQVIYLLSQRGLLKLEDRDFPSYLSLLGSIRNEGSYPYLYYSTSTMNGGDYLYPRVEINPLECSTHSRSLYTLLLFSISFHKVPEGSTHL